MPSQFATLDEPLVALVNKQYPSAVHKKVDSESFSLTIFNSRVNREKKWRAFAPMGAGFAALDERLRKAQAGSKQVVGIGNESITSAPLDQLQARVDVRTMAEHIQNIREVLDPPISDLANIFGVTRQAVYKWMRGSVPDDERTVERLRKLSHAADVFLDASVSDASHLLKVKTFNGRSMLDLFAAEQLQDVHLQALINEEKAMQAAKDRFGTPRRKSAPSEDWRTEFSIPGGFE